MPVILVPAACISVGECSLSRQMVTALVPVDTPTPVPVCCATEVTSQCADCCTPRIHGCLTLKSANRFTRDIFALTITPFCRAWARSFPAMFVAEPLLRDVIRGRSVTHQHTIGTALWVAYRRCQSPWGVWRLYSRWREWFGHTTDVTNNGDIGTVDEHFRGISGRITCVFMYSRKKHFKRYVMWFHCDWSWIFCACPSVCQP